MSKNKVTQEQIAKLISEAKIDVATVQEKCTVVTVTLKSGFILSESSACVDKANYNEEIGVRCCMERIERKLWELEGYALQKELAECDMDCEDVREKTAKERVEEEKAEVVARAQKLAQFLQSKSSDKLNDGERYLLQLQLQKMFEYADILTARLGVWREIV